MADVETKVDWGRLGEDKHREMLNHSDTEAQTVMLGHSIRATFEPLVKAAFSAQADSYALAGTREALRAALDALPKVGENEGRAL